MKKLSPRQWLFCVSTALPLFCGQPARAQCRHKLNKATRQMEHYHHIPLDGKREYLVLTRTGDERIFSYNNEDVDLAFHVQMFTEIRFVSKKGDFSLFTTTSDRTRWHTVFTLSAPLNMKELAQMENSVQMKLLLPEETKTFSFNEKKQQMMKQALTCMK